MKTRDFRQYRQGKKQTDQEYILPQAKLEEPQNVIAAQVSLQLVSSAYPNTY